MCVDTGRAPTFIDWGIALLAMMNSRNYCGLGDVALRIEKRGLFNDDCQCSLHKRRGTIGQWLLPRIHSGSFNSTVPVGGSVPHARWAPVISRPRWEDVVFLDRHPLVPCCRYHMTANT
jgi:hypothetical protein